MPDVRTHTPRGELTRVGARTSTADLRVEDWFLPSFQAAWWNETRSIRNPLAHIGRGGVMATLVTDTASDFRFAALSRSTSPITLTAARSLAKSLRAAASSITEWVEEREYQEQFKEVVEPVSGVWLKRLSRFKSGPEIPVSWDDGE